MDAAILAFIGSVATLITSLVIAYFNRQTAHQVEAVKAELHDIKSKSYFKFSKYHELQIEAIKHVYPEAIELLHALKRFESKSFYNESDDVSERLQLLQNTAEDFYTSFKKNSVFLGSDTAEVIDQLLKPVQNYISAIRNELFMTNSNIAELVLEAKDHRIMMRREMRKNVPLIIKQLEINLKEVLVKSGE